MILECMQHPQYKHPKYSEYSEQDNDVLSLAHFAEILPVVTKQAVLKIHLDGSEQTSTRYEIVPTAVS